MKEATPKLVHFAKSKIEGHISVPIQKTLYIYPADIPECFLGPYRDLLKFVIELPDAYDGLFVQGLQRLQKYLDAVEAEIEKCDESPEGAPDWYIEFEDDFPKDWTISENEDLEELLRDIDEMLNSVQKGSNLEAKLFILNDLLRATELYDMFDVERLVDRTIKEVQKR